MGGGMAVRSNFGGGGGYNNQKLVIEMQLGFEKGFEVRGRNALNINVEVQVSILSMKNTVLAYVSIEFWTS